MNIDFTDRVALVTGATRGIGKATVEVMHQAGAMVYGTGTSPEKIALLNEQIQQEGTARLKYLAVDLADQDSIEAFLKEIEPIDLDIVVNNAGVNKVDNFVNTNLSDFVWMNKINLEAPYQLLRKIGPKMVARGYGKVVNVASIWSVVTRPGRSIYTTTKNGIVGLTETLAVEWAADNVLVNAISPGFTLTELTRTTNTPEQLEKITSLIPARRMAEPEEMAITVAFLCSELNTYITGKNIIIDGGYTNV